jgi:hypothetical protein
VIAIVDFVLFGVLALASGTVLLKCHRSE